MKKIIISSIIIFWVVTGAILGNNLLAWQAQKSAGQQGSAAVNNLTPDVLVAQGQDEVEISSLSNIAQAASTDSSSSSSGKILTIQEVASHNNANDCWMIISGKIYDFTSYLPQHLGGAGTMLPYCGKDATTAFATKDKNPARPHSSYAQGLFDQYFIGSIGQKVASSSALASKPSASSSSQASKASSQQIPKTSTNIASLPLVSPLVAPAQSLSPSPSLSTNQSSGLALSQIATHNTAASCWMIVNGKVYDVTSYLPRHPGGINAILPYCGKDGGAAFAGLPHSQNANTILASYFVGNVGSAPTPTPTPTPTLSPAPTFVPKPAPVSTPTPTPSRQPRNDDDDDD